MANNSTCRIWVTVCIAVTTGPATGYYRLRFARGMLVVLPPPPQTTVRRMLAVLLTLISLGALKIATTVIMPLALAVFVLFIAWPLYAWLRSRLPNALAYGLTLLTIVVVLAVFVYGLVYSIQILADQLPNYTDRVTKVVHNWYAWIRHFGLQVARLDELVRQLLGQISAGASTLLSSLYNISETVLVTIAYVMMGLWEAPQFFTRLHRATPESEVHEVVDVLQSMMHQYRRYALVRTFTSAMIGVCTILFCWALGLDFAFIWGLFGFLMNYIPVLGAVIAVVPPVLFAIIQFGGVTFPLVVLFTLFFIHFSIGNYVDPALQGRQLSMSPLMVLFSVLFWGWMWGVPGALLGVPLMVALVVVTSHYGPTRWIALLLTDSEAELVPARVSQPPAAGGGPQNPGPG